MSLIIVDIGIPRDRSSFQEAKETTQTSFHRGTEVKTGAQEAKLEDQKKKLLRGGPVLACAYPLPRAGFATGRRDLPLAGR